MKITSTQKIAGFVSALALLTAGVACSNTVDGTGEYVGQGGQSSSNGKSSSEKSSGKSSSGKSSGKSSSGKSSSEKSSSTSENGNEGGDVAKAPDQSFLYENDVEVSLSVATPKDYSGVLSSEEGRAIAVHIKNPSKETIQMGNYRQQSSVMCGDNYSTSQYIFGTSSAPDPGPTTLAPGQNGDYELAVAIRKENLGSECLITIIFEVDGIDQSGIDPAKFSMVIS